MNNSKTNNDAVKKSRAKKKKILEDMKSRRSYLEGTFFLPFQYFQYLDELSGLKHENQVCDNDISMLERLMQKDPSQLTQNQIDYLNEQLAQLDWLLFSPFLL